MERQEMACLASNAHGPQISCVGRESKVGSIENIPCPQVVLDYNTHMGYADKADMIKSIYMKLTENVESGGTA